jgi:hypothetical protein
MTDEETEVFYGRGVDESDLIYYVEYIKTIEANKRKDDHAYSE